MKKIRLTKPSFKKTLPFFVIFGVLVIAGTIAYATAPKPQFASTLQKVQKSKPLVSTQVMKPSITSLPKKVLGASTYEGTSSPITPQVTTVQTAARISPQSTIQSANTNASSQESQSTQQTSLPIATPTTHSTSSGPTVTPTPLSNIVSLQIQDPAGTSNFTVALKSGANACDVLQESKDEGEINSVTFDDSYMSTLHSRYVVEINGYQNNWTFTDNGSSPNGCSLINPKPNDSIVWKFS